MPINFDNKNKVDKQTRVGIAKDCTGPLLPFISKHTLYSLLEPGSRVISTPGPITPTNTIPASTFYQYYDAFVASEEGAKHILRPNTKGLV
jgi:hypothetical protein